MGSQQSTSAGREWQQMAANSGNHNLTAAQQRALASLMSQRTVELAAIESQVGLRTLYRWLSENEAFKAEYLKLRREVTNQVVLQLQKSMTNALNVLVSVMNDPESVDSVRVAAAKEILDRGFRQYEVEVLEQKLKVLEEAYENNSFNGHFKAY